ncbi:MAG TPA: glycosyltransferase family 1 protein [Pyrinomonadaceae bacterium]|nr:glycosyltransferase family 1 protein [Pyrinomonadaceae bacterium]
MLHALREMAARGCADEFMLFTRARESAAEEARLRASGWETQPILPPSAARRAFAAARGVLGERAARRLAAWLRVRRHRPDAPGVEAVSQRPELGRWLRRCGVQLMLYPAPTTLTFETGLPSVMAIHDLQHRLQPDFPEVSAGGEWERREHLYRNAARHATLLLADSEVGREDILNLYGRFGATPGRVKVLPFLPAHYLAAHVTEAERLRVRATHRLPERYFFYPAHFWPHKNHARLVRALGLLKHERQINAHVVFCGSHTGGVREATFAEADSLAKSSGVARQIHHLGYVPDADMSALYAESSGLVMPTFFGPTNIPIVEAWAAGCPVLTSDIRGVREQAGDAALLVDPRSVESIADGLRVLWTDAGVRDELVRCGRRRLSAYGPVEYRERLSGIIKEAKSAARSRLAAGAPRPATPERTF